MDVLLDFVPVLQYNCILFCQVYTITVGDIKTSNRYTLIGFLVNIFKHTTRFGRKGHHQVSVIRILRENGQYMNKTILLRARYHSFTAHKISEIIWPKHLQVTKFYFCVSVHRSISQIKHQLDAALWRLYFCRVTLHVPGVKRRS
jgi:hypothetical protein